MAYTVSMVRNSKPDLLNTASRDAETSAQRVDAQIAQGRDQMTRLRDDWHGAASDAAGKQYDELVGYQRSYSGHLRDVKRVLALHATKLVDFRAKLDAAVNDAEVKFDVADDGSVSLGKWLAWYLLKNPTQVFKVEGMRIEVESTIKALLAQFEAEDLAAGNAIRQIDRELS